MSSISEKACRIKNFSFSNPGEEVVISGIAGRFPESDNLTKFKENLFNKRDLVTDDDRRWKSDDPEIPRRTGKVNNIEKFDAEFFGIQSKDAQTMDPLGRLLLEHTYEAIIDAGVNPQKLRGTNTGVFLTSNFSDSENALIYGKNQNGGSGLLGSSRSMLANRISHWLGTKGPSYNIDGACSSTLMALDIAYRAIKTGECNDAIVGACQLCLNPFMSLQFSIFGVLSTDGRCKSFDADADGYCRSEAICVMYIQKAKDAKRIYANLVYTKTNCDGFKEQGITFPSSEMQSTLLQQFYNECGVSPSSLAYVEAHGAGTKVGDTAELNSIERIFCPGRNTPLRIGAVKSNMGHSEPANGACSISKVIIAMESGCIPPNLHYNRPRKECAALVDGRMVVVTEPTPWDGGYVGVNAFGFGGTNGHILLKSNTKNKINEGAPNDDLPRLVVVSGRTQEAVKTLLDDLESRQVDVEYLSLLHNIHAEDIPGHLYRGYTILPPRGFPENHNNLRDSQYYSQGKPPVWFLFSGMRNPWIGMDESLLKIPVFLNAIQKCDSILKRFGINVIDILTKKDSKISTNVSNSLIATAVIQIGLVEVLTSIGIVPDNIIGNSLGELGCSYADNCLTIEQIVLSVYHQGMILSKCGTILDHKEPINLDNMNLSKLVYLEEVISHGKLRARKWLDSSILYENENDLDARKSSVQFERLVQSVPDGAVVIEITSHGLLQTILCKSSSENLSSMVNRENKNNMNLVLQAIGKMYETGLHPQLSNLYPDVEYPVSRGTPMISPLIRWEHSLDWFVPKHKTRRTLHTGERIVEIKLSDEKYKWMSGHVLDGRTLVPAIGYLTLVWETVALMRGEVYDQFSIVFENVRFHRATTLPEQGSVQLVIMVQKGSGRFEISEGKTSVVTGYVRASSNSTQEYSINDTLMDNHDPLYLKEKDFYKEMRLRGYHYAGLFRGIKEASLNATKGVISWMENWTVFMDSMLQLNLLRIDTRALCVITEICKLVINPKEHLIQLGNMPDNNKAFIVNIDKHLGIVVSGGVEFQGVKSSPIAKRKPTRDPVLENYKFVAHRDCAEMELGNVIRIAVQLALENYSGVKVQTIELIENMKDKSLENLTSPLIQKVLNDLPLVQANVNVIAPVDTFPADELPSTIQISELSRFKTKSAQALLAVSYGLLANRDTKTLNQLEKIINYSGFLLAREPLNSQTEIFSTIQSQGLDIILEKRTDKELVFLLRKKPELSDKIITSVIRVNNNEFTWLPKLQATLKAENDKKSSTNGRIILVSEGDLENGLMGLVKSLRKEPGGLVIQGLLIQDLQAPKFSLEDPFYAKQLDLRLALNVLRPGKLWGSYRFHPLETMKLKSVDHVQLNQLSHGNLGSLKWVEGRIQSNNENIIKIYYSAINFRDIMISGGKLPATITSKTRTEQENLLGFEYSGKDVEGRRVMGIIGNGGLSNLCVFDSELIWSVPDNWTLEDAATVPVVYSTAYYALIMNGKMKKGDKILIHSGSGGVGQAAITLALCEGCEVFTTVGTQEKREFIKKQFPQIDDDHIGNSRDTSFEQLIFYKTKGRGVDIVLNSLAEEKLLASIRCLTEGGRFLEIGKFDLVANNPIGMEVFLKGISFYGIHIDNLFFASSERKTKLVKMFDEGLKNGAIKPLPRTVFTMDQVETAFRYMAVGEHIGKVMIKIRDEDEVLRKSSLPLGFPRYHCSEDGSNIILGGLGGFGLELADWLVLRGARKLVLTSRRGITTGYQRLRINTWKSYGVRVIIIVGKDASTHQGCKDILTEALSLGPIEAIFNLAVILKDALFENQTIEAFEQSFKVKAWATKEFDKLSRIMCPDLKKFVVFSSVSCGRGNPGQTNYAMSNAIMERICENRVAENLPGLAIQWGGIGDVGLVAEMHKNNKEVVIAGTLPQTISSCLQVLDHFLQQNLPVVSSVVNVEKIASINNVVTLIDTVMNIMGLESLKNISLHTPLPELGIDSMMAVEIKQTLEREFGVFLTTEDIRGLNFIELDKISWKQSGIVGQ